MFSKLYLYENIFIPDETKMFVSNSFVQTKMGIGVSEK